MEIKTHNSKLKAGTYYVGDPCHVFSDEVWQELLQKTRFFKNNFFEIDGYKGFASGTAYGDGIYVDNFGKEYGVDAGLLGVVPIELVKRFVDNWEGVKDNIKRIANVVDFDKDFYPTEEEGFFQFGHIEIETGEQDEEEEE